MIYLNKKTSLNLICFIVFLLSLNLIAGYIIFPTDLIQDDSQGYIAFSSSRTIGYPVFLWCIRTVFKTYVAVPFFQLLIYSIASYKLAISIKDITKTAIIPYFLLALLWLNPEWIKCHFQIMTESLSVSFLCLFMASLIRAHQTGNYHFFLRTGVFFVLGILVRPINLYCFPIFISAIYFICQKHKHISLKRVVCFLIVPFVLYVVGSGTHAYIHKQANDPSFFGHVFLGKVGFFVTPDVKTEEPAFMKQLSEHTREFREMIQQNGSIQNYYQFTASYTDIIRYRVLDKIPLSEKQLQDKSFYTKRAVEIIKHYPIQYAKDVAIQLAALWLLLDIKTPTEKESMSDFVEKFYVLKNSDICAEIYFNKRVCPIWQALIVRLVFGSLFLITLIGLFIPFVKSAQMVETPIFTFSFASYIIHSGFLCIAMSHEGFPRYSMSLWPALFVPICLIGDHVLCFFQRHR